MTTVPYPEKMFEDLQMGKKESYNDSKGIERLHATRRIDIYKGNEIAILKPSNHKMKRGGRQNQEH